MSELKGRLDEAASFLDSANHKKPKRPLGGGLFFYALSDFGVSGDGEAAQLPLPYGRTDQTQFST
jgi:hypothetical protein